MSGAQLKQLSQIDDELQRHLHELSKLSAHFPLDFEWKGLNPHQSIDEVNWMPKRRYEIMRSYLPKRGDRALYMMGLTCTVQANLDITSAEDFAFKLRLATGVGPLVTALFANSPIYNGRRTRYRSYRAHVWTRVDPDRCGIQRFVFESDASFADYTDWAVKIPLFFLERDGELKDISGRATFADLMAGKIAGCEATLDDWKVHLSTLFPEARPRPHLEVRSADVVPPEAIVACPALWKGILYDDDCAMAAWDLVKRLSYSQRLQFADDVARDALIARRLHGAGKIQDLCRELLEIARLGLVRQAEAGRGEAGDEAYLNPLHELVARGKTYADLTLEATKKV
jgi:glutamate--cysteine ligase